MVVGTTAANIKVAKKSKAHDYSYTTDTISNINNMPQKTASMVLDLCPVTQIRSP